MNHDGMHGSSVKYDLYKDSAKGEQK